jgi:hypothetical protein
VTLLFLLSLSLYNVSVSVLNRRLVNFVIARLAQMMSKKDTSLYSFGQNIPTSSLSHLCSCTRFVVGVTNKREREGAPKSLVECACVNVSLNLFFLPPSEGSPFPFMSQREGSEFRERDPRDRAASPPLRMGPIGLADDDGGAPMSCPGAMCGARPNGTGGAGLLGRRTGDVCSAEMSA